MGQKDQASYRFECFKGFQVKESMMALASSKHYSCTVFLLEEGLKSLMVL
jgi:hypothetical protein